MSDAITDNGRLADRRRVLASFAAAFVLHAALLVTLALGLGVSGGAPALPAVAIDLQVSSEPGMDAFAGSAAAGLPGTPTALAGSAAPAAAAPDAASSEPAGGKDSVASGFVIPTPRAQPAESAASAAAGPAFRETGGRTGVAQGIPTVSSPVPAPSVAPVQQGNGRGTASLSGPGESSAQRSGTGVLVTGTAGSASSGPLDLAQLDKALAGGKGGKSGSASGGAGTGGAGTGGAGTGGTGTGGTGTVAGTGGQSYSIVWGKTDSGKGRTVVSRFSPKLPSRVSEQGLSLSVTVSFTLLPDGLIGAVALQQSSGYADVDAAVIDAIRRWHFTPAPGAGAAKGVIPYIIRAQ